MEKCLFTEKKRQSAVKSSLLSSSGQACVTMQKITLISVLSLSPLLCKQSGAGNLEPGLDAALAISKPAHFLWDYTSTHHLTNFKVVQGRGMEWVRAENLLPVKKTQNCRVRFCALQLPDEPLVVRFPLSAFYQHHYSYFFSWSIQYIKNPFQGSKTIVITVQTT